MNTPQPSASRGPWRLLRIGLMLLAAVALLAVATGWGIPALLKAQLPARLGQALGRPVSLQAVAFEPGRLALRLQGLRIGAAGPAGAAQGDPLLQVDGLLVDFGLGASLRQRAPVIEAVAVDGARLRLARTAPGHYDIDDLIARLSATPQQPASAEPLRFALNNLALHDAQIRFDDQPAGRVHEVQALTLTLPFLSSLPDDAATPVEPRLQFTVNGTRVDASQHLLPFAQTRSGDLTLAFADLDLKPWLGYLPASLPVRLQRGRLGAELTLQVAQPPQGAPTLQVRGRLSLDDLALAEPDGTPLAAWRALKLELLDLQPLRQRARLGTLRIDGAELQLSRDARGRLNLQRLQPGTPPDAPGPDAGTATPSPWQVELAALQIDAARVHWHDATLRPAAGYRLDGLALELRDLQWPLKAPMPLTAQANLHPAAAQAPTPGRPAATAAGQLRIDGQVSDREATLALRLDGLDLGALAPYARQALQPRLSGQLSTQAQLHWAADPAVLALTLDTATLKDVLLRDGAATRATAPLASMRQLQLSGTTIDLLAHRLDITRLQLTQPALALSRRADGQLNMAQWLQPAAPAARPGRPEAATTGRAATATQAAPWRLALKDLSLTGGRVAWSDATVAAASAGGPLRADLTGLKLRLQGLSWPASTRGALPRLQLAASVAGPAVPGAAPDRGDIDWSGRIGLAPLQADGRLKLRALPVHLAMPYAGEAMQASLRHADLSLDTQLKARSTPAGWQVTTDGDLQLNEVMVHGKGAPDDSGEPLLRWQALSLQGLVLALAPPARPRIEVREQALSDFYSRLVLNERGHLNLEELAARPPASASAPAPAAPNAASSPAAAAPPLPAPAASAPAADALAVDLALGPTQLRNGRIDFSDYYIKPNYSARMTELNGMFGAFRSGTREMAALTLRGRVADTALLDISGQLNPTAQPLALDIRARATDLELAPLSPYAGKYAGYAIERGKLSMDVAYKIEADGKLEASNQVILNQLTFGERVESPSATQLPVLLAVALLKDRNGVIDINLPVSGSINDPQFSVGGIVWKVILNLLGKALTAPFALLAGGGSDDLSQVGFQPGTARFTDAGRQSLDRVAKALAERPGLMMTVTGAADTVAEREAAQLVALEERLQAEHRREQLRAAPSAGAAAAAAAPGASAPALPPLSVDDRARLLKRLYQQTTLPDKPRNAIGLLRDLPPAEMEARLRAAIQVSDETMRELALQRGLAVRDALIAQGLPSERLFLAAPKLHLSGEGDAAWQPQVTLTLSAK